MDKDPYAFAGDPREYWQERIERTEAYLEYLKEMAQKAIQQYWDEGKD